MTFEIFKNSRKGILNKISDVKGVNVGHSTIRDGKIKTGVTCIMPHDGDVFKEKLVANSYIINGYGKSLGLVQLEELGTLESPIFMTNTMSLGRVLDASMKWMIGKYPKLGDKSGAPNIIVTECNDGVINDMRGLHIKGENVLESLRNIKEDFEEGSVGAGTGMISFNLKSGIGSASRIIEIGGEDYTLGSLVLSNFGRIKDLKIEGRPLGREMYLKSKEKREDKDKGSIIIVLATDLPLSSRQLKRLAKRATIGLGNVGSYLGHGSGDIVIAFSTANKIVGSNFEEVKVLKEDLLDDAFRACAESVEESVIKSLIYSKSEVTKDRKKIFSLEENLKNLGIDFWYLLTSLKFMGVSVTIN